MPEWMNTDPEHYRSRVGVKVERPSRIGWMTIPVLEFLKGQLWDRDALSVVSAVDPTWIRVVGDRGETTCDSRPGRVTVHVGPLGHIQEITQEVRVALINRVNGHELSKYISRCRASQVAAKEVPGIQPSEGGFDGDCG